MAGLGRKTFSPGDVLTSSDVQGYLMDQAVMVFAGTAARTSAIPSPSAGMVAYSTATQLQVYNGTAWVDASTGYGSASGTAAASTAITVAGTAYTMLTFTTSSTLTVGRSGLFDICLVGGGGGGGSSTTGNGGGGGGGVRTQTVYFSANQTVTIGAGGAGAQSTGGLIGGRTSVGTQSDGVSVGGGGGGMGLDFGKQLVGASGGGAVASLAGSPTNDSLTGFAGGSATSVLGGGGGGAGEAGNTDGQSFGGDGFDASAFRGEVAATTFYGGGGAGGPSGTSGSGGGGAVAGAGTANTGGGGGAGANATNNGGAGGSGIVLIRFKTS